MASVSVTNTFASATTISSSQVNTNFSDLVTYINNRNSGSSAWDGFKTTGVALLANGSGAAPSVAFTSDTSTGLYRGGTSNISVSLGGTTTVEFTTATIRPGSDNTISCGATGRRWVDVWAVNGTIQTSVSDSKINIVELKPEDCKIPVAATFQRATDIHNLKQVGFIADTLPPECFAVDKDGNRSASDVYTSAVVGMLCQAARNDYDRLKNVEARLSLLEGK